MAFDLQLMPTAPLAIAMTQASAIYRDVLSAKIPRVRNVADLLERGHRPHTNIKCGILIDIRA